MKLSCGKSLVAKIRLPRLTLVILTSPGYLRPMYVGRKRKSTRVEHLLSKYEAPQGETY